MKFEYELERTEGGHELEEWFLTGRIVIELGQGAQSPGPFVTIHAERRIIFKVRGTLTIGEDQKYLWGGSALPTDFNEGHNWPHAVAIDVISQIGNPDNRTCRGQLLYSVTRLPGARAALADTYPKWADVYLRTTGWDGDIRCRSILFPDSPDGAQISLYDSGKHGAAFMLDGYAGSKSPASREELEAVQKELAFAQETLKKQLEGLDDL